MTIYWKLNGSKDHPLQANKDHNGSNGLPSQASTSGLSGSNNPAIKEAAQLLQRGETVAFPTETVYGLGADATQTQAVKRVFIAKGRPSDNPLIVHIAEKSQLAGLVAPPDETILRLMDAFWPGPLTIILPVLPGAVSPLVTTGLNTVGVRIPDHPVALELLKEAGCPIAAPSANSSGRPSPTHAEHVAADLQGKIGGILDGGPTGVGLESTVVELKENGLYILRPGGVTAEQLQATLPDTVIRKPDSNIEIAGTETPRAPGMKYAHYAPKGELQLVESASPERAAEWIRRELAAAKQRGETTGVLTFQEHQSWYAADLVIPCGRLSAPETIAHELYAALRLFDRKGISYILAETCPREGIGLAVMNRLEKAAGHRIAQI